MENKVLLKEKNQIREVTEKELEDLKKDKTKKIIYLPEEKVYLVQELLKG